MRTVWAVAVVGLVMVMASVGLAEALELGPFCSEASVPLGGTFNIRLISAGGNNFLMTGTQSGIRPLSGSFIQTSVNSGVFQFTLGAAGTLPTNIPTNFVSGTVNLQTGTATAICERNVKLTTGCGDGAEVTFTPLLCD